MKSSINRKIYKHLHIISSNPFNSAERSNIPLELQQEVHSLQKLRDSFLSVAHLGGRAGAALTEGVTPAMCSLHSLTPRGTTR